jgi:hypothetical protein
MIVTDVCVRQLRSGLDVLLQSKFVYTYLKMLFHFPAVLKVIFLNGL